MSNKQPQPGEWWQHDEGEGAIYRIHVIGKNAAGQTLFEDNKGNIEKIEDHGWHNWHHLPDCTGWDWQPETFPQYIIRKPPSVFADGGFLIRHSAEQAAHVQASGCILPFEWSAFCDGSLRDGNWIVVTRAEAEATIAEPEPPAESPDDWVTQDRVPARPGIDQAWWQYDHYDENIKKAFWPVGEGSFASSRKHGYRDTIDACTLRVRCRRKDLPPLPQQPTAPEPAKTRTVTLQEWACYNHAMKRWHLWWSDDETWVDTCGQAFATGNTRTIEVPCE